jgi:hypothetical protein
LGAGFLLTGTGWRRRVLGGNRRVDGGNGEERNEK